MGEASEFRAQLLAVTPAARDAWVDRLFGLEELPDDGPELPRGCVPYMPSSVDAILRVVDEARVEPSDVFVDVGAGIGRAAVLVHLLTGAHVVGVEIQSGLARAARELAARMHAPRVSFIHGDGVEIAARVPDASVFFLYCPFSGDRLTALLTSLEAIARTRTIRIACVDLPLSPCSWLDRRATTIGDVAIYTSVTPR